MAQSFAERIRHGSIHVKVSIRPIARARIAKLESSRERNESHERRNTLRAYESLEGHMELDARRTGSGEPLGKEGDEAQIEQLVKELKSEDEVIRARAADQVGMLGEKAASWLQNWAEC